MSEFRFYRCDEVRCPHCGTQLEFMRARKQGAPLLVQHPKADCPLTGKEFYAAPLVVELTEFKGENA